jgi:hypothetical protein
VGVFIVDTLDGEWERFSFFYEDFSTMIVVDVFGGDIL